MYVYVNTRTCKTLCKEFSSLFFIFGFDNYTYECIEHSTSMSIQASVFSSSFFACKSSQKKGIKRNLTQKTKRKIRIENFKIKKKEEEYHRITKVVTPG